MSPAMYMHVALRLKLDFSNLNVENFAGGDIWDGWILFDYMHKRHINLHDVPYDGFCHD